MRYRLSTKFRQYTKLMMHSRGYAERSGGNRHHAMQIDEEVQAFRQYTMKLVHSRRYAELSGSKN